MNKYLFQIKLARSFLLAAIFLGLAACSSVDNALDTTTGINYGNNTSVAILKSPEGLAPPEYDMTYALPEASAASQQSTVVDIRPPDLIK